MKTSSPLIIAATLIICGTTVSVNANAQKAEFNGPRHEVGISVGYRTTSEILNGISDISSMIIDDVMSTAITGGKGSAKYTYGDESFTPTVAAEYYYHFNKIIAFGSIVAFNANSCDMYYTWKEGKDGPEHNELCGKAKHQNFTIMPMVKFEWLQTKYVGLYSKAGLGATFVHDSRKDNSKREGAADYSDLSVFPNFQLTLGGIEVGTPTWRVFSEYGIGEQGIFCGGFRYKF